MDKYFEQNKLDGNDFIDRTSSSRKPIPSLPQICFSTRPKTISSPQSTA